MEMASRSEPLLEQALPPIAEISRLVDEAAALRQRRAAEFVSTYRRAARDVTRLSAEGARLVVARIDELRREITDRIRTLRTVESGAPFALRIAPQIEAEIQAALSTLIDGASADVAAILGEAFAAGSGVLPAALEASGFGVSIGTGISPALLTTLQTASGDLLTEVFTQLGEKIGRTVRQSIAGLDSSSATIEKVAELLRTSREVRAGLRRRIGIGFQAETITRLEMGQAFSAAQHASAINAGEIIPGLRKRWITRAKIRSGHLAVEAETRENPIPVAQRFRVTDNSRTGSSSFFTGRTGAGAQFVYRTANRPRQGSTRVDRMLFPRDPSAGPGNIVNCTCFVLEIPPGLENEIEEEVRRSDFGTT